VHPGVREVLGCVLNRRGDTGSREMGSDTLEMTAVAAGDVAALVRTMGYEVMPLRGAEDSVVRHVPLEVPLTVTTTHARGVAVTVDLTVRLRQRGYDVAPHLAARLFSDADELALTVARLRAEGVERAFVIGGDAPVASGPYPDALTLLRAMDVIGHPFSDVGIAGYPEGHGTIGPVVLEQAVRDKSPHATRIVTQMCFSARTTAGWAEALVESGIRLPVHVGLPGPVNRQKLIRISASLGLGASARFLSKQQGLWRFLLPGVYRPTRLVRDLSRAARSAPRSRIAGLHVFTFNELAGTELWRRRLLERIER